MTTPRTPGIQIGRVFGIPIFIDPSWLFIFAVITWSLGVYFTQQHPQWTRVQHWTIGALTSFLFFGSILFHELSHSLVARAYKIRVESITLFVFGGLARIANEAGSAMQEFNIAVAGPVSSLVLAGAFYALTLRFPYDTMIGALALWLAEINATLALFNLLPGFPLDGGRIFRAIVWGITKNFNRATKIAGASGKLIAYGMIIFGAWAAFSTRQWGPLWYAFIGWFLLNAARESVAQVTIRETLSGLRAADVMSQEIPTVPRDISLEEYSHEVLRTGRRCHLVTTGDRLVGMMNVHTLNTVPREEWTHMSVQAVMIPRDKILWATPQEPLLELLERLLAADVNQMPVVSTTESPVAAAAPNADGDDTAGTPRALDADASVDVGDHAQTNNAHIIGMVTRDSILRVMRTRTEVGTPSPAK
jgi:Zn-dependent protease/predicted transcriptional regulator